MIEAALWLAATWTRYTIAFAVLYHDQRLRNGGLAAMASPSEPAALS